MIAVVLLLLLLLLGAPATAPQEPAAAAPEAAITLEQVMADPDWIGRSPQRPYWALDGRSIYFSQEREGERRSDLVEIDLDGRELRRVPEPERDTADDPRAKRSRRSGWWVWEAAGDLYLRTTPDGPVRQLTRSVARESSPAFMSDGESIQFRRGGDTYLLSLVDGLERQPFELRDGEDPDAKEEDEPGYLEAQQERLFDVVAERKRRSEEDDERRKRNRAEDAERVPSPFYAGKGLEVARSTLSPDGRHLVLTLAKKGRSSGRRGKLPVFVTDSGYVETEDVRARTGTVTETAHRLVLIDLETRERRELDLAVLPGIADDPLAELRAAAKARAKARAKAEGTEGTDGAEGTDEAGDGAGATGTESAGGGAGGEDAEEGHGSDDGPEGAAAEESGPSKPRPVSVRRVLFDDTGLHAAVQVFSHDNKDRWIARIDLTRGALVPVHHLHDPAWINWGFNELGWVPGRDALWFLSEETGYSHLYRQTADADPVALTSGAFEVRSPELDPEGEHFLFVAAVDHPGDQDVWRLAVRGGRPERITARGGLTSFERSPDGEHLLLLRSSALHPPELYLATLSAEAGPREEVQLTRTTSPAFLGLPWAEPEFVAVPGRHGRPIWSRVYTPDGPAPEGGWPAVMFVHGAGYLQNAHKGWSSYFREFMFHTVLVQRGFVVIDMDYRASAGYGRDWRTAIYRRMGEPELEDFADGVDWLARERGVDRSRVGVYGGSYGGFMTLMALFREPDLFACGAALRPVTDWAHYNHSYTSNILNTPEVDPEAYERSSPIEVADGLARPLLMCHGMLDDNVLFQDTVRLVQRLIELEKEDWEVAIYPVEPHGFREPSSWLDEYRRILDLFETHLKPK